MMTDERALSGYVQHSKVSRSGSMVVGKLIRLRLLVHIW